MITSIVPAATWPTHYWLYAFLFFAAVALLAWLGSPQFKGWTGEWWVRSYLRRLDPAVYHSLHNLLVKTGDDGEKWSQIDHVVISPFGIFVIETKNLGGWIFASADSRDWKVTCPGRRKHFP